MADKIDDLKTLAHDLNNKLMIMKGWAELADKATPEGAETKMFLTRLTAQIDKTNNSLLDIMENKVCSYEIGGLFQEFSKELGENYEIGIEVVPQAELTVAVNKARFENILENIVKNSKEADAKNIIIYVNSSGFLIADDGRGFPKHILKDLNDPEGVLRSTKEHGHGIGTKSILNFCKSQNWDLKFANIKLKKDSYMNRGANIVVKIK